VYFTHVGCSKQPIRQLQLHNINNFFSSTYIILQMME